MALFAFVWLSAALLGAGAAGAFFGRSSFGRVGVYGFCLGACGVQFFVAVGLFFGSVEPQTVALPVGIPWIGTHLRLDALSAFFLMVINLGGAVSSLYALGYGRHESAPNRVLPFYPLFLFGMNLTALADDAFTFLVGWEFMSVASWLLVVSHHREEGNTRAGTVYFLMTAVSAQCLLIVFALLSNGEGRFLFDAIRQAPPSPEMARVLAALVVVGAGAKAGLVPLHVWLPLAHPAAPSHVSALMSGVMTKVAVYALVRFLFDLLGPSDWTWGAGLMLLGGVTAVMGILYALTQSDLKRLLAYSSVENIGIIAIGLGLALAFRAAGLSHGAALALTAALFHVFNHSLYKSLLFFGAGAVLNATSERNIDRLGGLIHGMPITAFCFLVGAMAISALPPLNGFVSEWLTLQAILISPALPQWLLKFLSPAVGALLALSAALTAACFVKAFGITFLGRPRTSIARQARETDRWSLSAMILLSSLCFLAGGFPGVMVDALASVVAPLAGGRLPHQSAQSWLTLVSAENGRSSYNGWMLFLFILVVSGLTSYGLRRWFPVPLRRSRAWDCGYPETSPMTQYTAVSFSQPIRRVFGSVVFSAREKVIMPPPGDLRSARLVVTLGDPVWNVLYRPIIGFVLFAADVVNKTRFFTIRHYLTMIFCALILLLMVLALWR
ncbi:hydrogenase-4 component B [Azospirillaceae bacterium]